MPFADVNGLELCYETAGNPFPALVVHARADTRVVRAISDLVATVEHA